jgi:hypothetical protein
MDTPHVPDIKSVVSLLDVLTLCFLVIASNFLDPRTYFYPGVSPKDVPSDDDVKRMAIFDLNDMDAVDRRRCSYARGLAWKITRWLDDNFEVYRGVVTEQVSMKNLINMYFASLIRKILDYKSKAQSSKIQGFPNCNHETLEKQIKYCFKGTGVEAAFELVSSPTEDLDYRLPLDYEIRQRHPTTVNNHSEYHC